MSNELEHEPAVAGSPTMGRFGQWMPGIRFETDPGMGAGTGGAPAALADGDGAGAATDALGDDGAGAAVAAPVAPVVAPQPSWDDDQFADLAAAQAERLFNERMAPLVPLLERFLGDGSGAPGGAAAAAGAPGALNPWDENFGDNLDARFQQFEQLLNTGLERLAAPLAAREQAEIVEEGNQRLQDMAADEIARNGDFAADPETNETPGKQLVRPLADLFFPAIAEKYGPTPRAAAIAIDQAAGIVRQIEANAAKVALAKETNRLSTLAGANGEPAVAGVGAQGIGEIRATTISEGLSEVTRRHAPLLRGGQ